MADGFRVLAGMGRLCSSNEQQPAICRAYFAGVAELHFMLKLGSRLLPLSTCLLLVWRFVFNRAKAFEQRTLSAKIPSTGLRWVFHNFTRRRENGAKTGQRKIDLSFSNERNLCTKNLKFKLRYKIPNRWWPKFSAGNALFSQDFTYFSTLTEK